MQDMRFPKLRYSIIAILAGLLMLQGCAHNRVTQQDRSRPGTIGIVRAEYAPELGLDTFAVGGVAGATKGVFSGLGACVYGASQAGVGGILLAPFLCPAIGVWGIYDGVNQAVPAEEARDIDRFARNHAETLQLQQRLSEQLSRHLAEYPEYSSRSLEAGGPSERDAKPDYRSLKREGIDTVLEVRLLKLVLRGTGTNPDLAVQAYAFYRLVRTDDNGEVEKRWIVTESASRKFSQWADKDATLLKGAIEDVLNRLGEEIVDKAILKSTYMLCPADPFKGGGTISVQTLQPTLSWDEFPSRSGKRQDAAVRSSVSSVTYEIRLWKDKGEFYQHPGSAPAYERKGLMQTSHLIEEPLEPSTVYAWTVRARFVVDGQTRLSSWEWTCTQASSRYYYFRIPEHER
jgi:hypothetical protein